MWERQREVEIAEELCWIHLKPLIKNTYEIRDWGQAFRGTSARNKRDQGKEQGINTHCSQGIWQNKGATFLLLIVFTTECSFPHKSWLFLSPLSFELFGQPHSSWWHIKNREIAEKIWNKECFSWKTEGGKIHRGLWKIILGCLLRKQTLNYRNRQNVEDGEWQVGQRAQEMFITKRANVAASCIDKHIVYQRLMLNRWPQDTLNNFSLPHFLHNLLSTFLILLKYRRSSGVLLLAEQHK